VARSAYKLLEIQQKHAIIPPGGYVLDLGCHPGAWLQVACEAMGAGCKGGLVLGIDIQETTVPGRYTDDRVKVLHGDAREVDGTVWKSYAARGLDVVLSGASSGVVFWCLVSRSLVRSHNLTLSIVVVIVVLLLLVLLVVV